MIRFILVLFPFLLLTYLPSAAQKIFSEGVIRYDVYTDSNKTPAGTYTITIKNNLSRRELAMKNGYTNILITDYKTGHSISMNADAIDKYALSLTSVEMEERNKPYRDAVITMDVGEKKIAGMEAHAAKIKYVNQDNVTFYFTDEFMPPHEGFNNLFPGLKGLPLDYEVHTSMSNLHFIAASLETKSIDAAMFDIPKNYKIVSREELERIKD